MRLVTFHLWLQHIRKLSSLDLQTGGSKTKQARQNMSTGELMLKAAVHFTVGRLCQKVGEEHHRPFSRQIIAALAETTFRQCDIFARDLEAFAR
uniref:Centromere protein S n=1 Tax=Cynoglossus semilaevis TaxID=244447 RepID=A0A3P8X474_CYNSE